ncbi:hypothetical protein ACPUYX_00985 [Desulfosporosinus sp. SYSU MS00001]|uniref:hypothetical protein n=1 Tax=Desulfosporosinus sp. SYSU MS00001 TaxID=3416284 RepID=UPI003CE83CD6
MFDANDGLLHLRSLLTAYVKTSRCLTLRPWLKGRGMARVSLISVVLGDGT